MRMFLSVIIGVSLLAGGGIAQELVPERRMAISNGVDFYGSDLQPLFDTTLKSCQIACLSDPNCQAFTYNTRSSACFPKSDVSEQQPYDGALSARIFTTDAGVLARVPARIAELDMLHEQDFVQARTLAEGLADLHYVGDLTAGQLLKAAADSRASGDPLAALRFTGAALTLTDAADQWVEYGRLALLVKTDRTFGRQLRRRALSSGLNSYLRSGSASQRASSLVLIAEALEKQGRGRVMIPILRLAQSLAPREEIALRLDDAIGKYGFNLAEDSVESDSAQPRICAIFNEDLVQAGLDYTPFVQLPEAGLSVEAEGSQICISGVTHGKRYRLTFRKGLPAESGETLMKPVTLTLYVRDRSPLVRFPGRAYVLPRTKGAALPIETVNLSEVELTLLRVSDRNIIRALQNNYVGRPLDYYEEEYFEQDMAEVIWTGKGAVQSTLNVDMTTRLPMDEAIAGLPAGIYALKASIANVDPWDNPSAMQWFVLSDLGVATMSGVDGLHVFVRSLTDASLKPGVTVTLISNANSVLGTATTDDQGYAVFPAALTRGVGGAAPALVTLQDGEDDLTFLSLKDPEFDLSDRGVEGREPAPPIDIFLTTDRGAYRVGETIHATALARDVVAKAIVGLPITAVLKRPDGVEYTRQLSSQARAGGHVFALPLGVNVPRGTWRLSLYADPDAAPLVSQTLLVEDFLPERIDFDLALPEGPIRKTEPVQLTVTARYLFGAPGAGLAVEGSVLLRPTDRLDAYPGYRFGRYDDTAATELSYFSGDDLTDAAGVALVTVDFPEIDSLSTPLEARFTVSVLEGSGRPVERRLTHLLTPDGPVIGIKARVDGVVPEGSEAGFDLLALDADQKPTAMQVRWTVSRVQTRYQWYQLYGNWNWEPTTTRTRVASGEALLDGAPLSITAPVEWGRYKVKVERLNGPYAASSLSFYAGWYAPADTSDTPDTLALSLDKPAYRTGETATLRLVPRTAGKALITVLSNRLITMKAVDVVAGENLITLPVTDEWGAGVYVTAQVIRPLDVAAGHNPSRAIGLTYAPVDPAQKQLAVAFEMPAEAAPRAPMQVALKVDGILPGETAYATIAAVDLGILNLTGFEAPDPLGHYFGQRKLGVGLRDVYGRLIDGMNGAMGSVRSGGDAGNARRQSPPPTEDLLAFFQGPIEVDADGYARASFDLPAFNGTVRLMAVVWSSGSIGQASTDILVRDPVVVTASLPKFLAPGDQSRMLLEIIHASGPSGRMGLDVSAQGLVIETGGVPSGIDLADKGKISLSVPITAEKTGVHSIRVALTTPDGKVLVKELILPVVVNDPEVARTARFDLGVDKVFTFDANVFDGFVPGTGMATLSVGPLARFDAPGLLAALDRYPYGCTEQITSRALPLLYFADVARAMGLDSQASTSERVNQAIAEVLTNQSSNGAFGLWGPSSGDFWLDAYVSDFLSRARARGFEVPDQAFRMAMDNLRNRIAYAPDFDSGGTDLAYALMVLAREGAAAMGDLRYYADVKGGSFSTPLALAQLGAALASYGDQTRADAMFTRAEQMMRGTADDYNSRLWRSDYGSNLRDAAAVLTLAVESGSQAIDRDALLRSVLPLGFGRNRSTQEATWSLLAANALIGDASMQGITVDGVPVDGPLVKVLQAQTAGGGALRIHNGSDKNTAITLTTFGVPSIPEPAGGNGYRIKRLYFTMDGVEIDPEAVPVGSRMVAVVQVTPYGKGEARLMINDPLPGGFEIDNPTLLQGGEIAALKWLNLGVTPERVEFRSDRFLAAVDWRSDRMFRLAYIVRAISPGNYSHPAASVEDMYRPQFRAHSDSGRMIIVP